LPMRFFAVVTADSKEPRFMLLMYVVILYYARLTWHLSKIIPVLAYKLSLQRTLR
jgi:hypothetical protein